MIHMLHMLISLLETQGNIPTRIEVPVEIWTGLTIELRAAGFEVAVGASQLYFAGREIRVTSKPQLVVEFHDGRTPY